MPTRCTAPLRLPCPTPMRRATPYRWPAAATAAVLLTMMARTAFPFALLPNPNADTVVADLQSTARWSPEPDPFGYGTGFHDGLQVAVAADFGSRLGITSPEDQALLAEVIRNAFAAWETPDLHFDVDFNRVPVEGTAHDVDSGWEFDLFAVAASHPAFNNTNYFGVTYPNWEFASNRLLTNGQRTDGLVITAVDIYINVDLVLNFSMLIAPERKADALQRLLMHEIGHGLGLGHPNDVLNLNFDTGADPFDPMRIVPETPFADLIYSPNRNPRAIMSNDRSRAGPFVFYTELQYDDRGGRDALYPSLISCAGDCSGDGRVDVTELLTAINIALSDGAPDTCAHADQDHDNRISIDEIIRAVGVALDGCS